MKQSPAKPTKILARGLIHAAYIFYVLGGMIVFGATLGLMLGAALHEVFGW